MDLKIKEIENKLNEHGEQIVKIIQLINELLAPPEKSKKKIGFNSD